MKPLFHYLFPVILIFSIIFLLSSLTNPYSLLPYPLYYRLKTDELFGTRIIEIVSEIIHLSLFGLLAAFTTKVFVGNRQMKTWHLVLAFVLISLFGLVDEVRQINIPGRAFQMIDLLFDVIGALIGVLFIRNRYLRAQKIGNKSLNVK